MSREGEKNMNNRGVVQEKRFDYKGFPCVILFMDMGHRCGYVGLPYDYNRTKIDTDLIDCHGGLTYGPSGHLHLQDDQNIVWIGFDTAHYMDGHDIESVRKYFGEERAKRVFDFGEGPGKTLEFCEKECKKIVDQIVGMMGAE